MRYIFVMASSMALIVSILMLTNEIKEHGFDCIYVGFKSLFVAMSLTVTVITIQSLTKSKSND